MKKIILNFHVAVITLLMGCMMMAGCNDSNYNLGEIDGKIAFGNEQGLALPGNNSTREMSMREVFNLSENGSIKVEEQTGNYIFSQEATPNPASFSIDKVEMSKENESNDNYNYDFGEVFGGLFSARSAYKAPEEETGMREIKHFSFRTPTPSAIRHLVNARFNSVIDITLDFSKDLIDNINDLAQLRVDVPTFFDIDVTVYQVKTDKTETLYNSDVFDKASNTLLLSSFASNQRGVHAIINLNGIVFNQESNRDKTRGYYLTMDADSILLEGGVNMQAIYNQSGSSRSADSRKAMAAQSMAIACNTQVGQITLDGGEGTFHQSIDLEEGMGSFKVKDLPEFLNDEEVNLRISNPRIILEVSSDVGLDGNVTDAKLIAEMKDGSKKEIAIENFSINRHDDKSGKESTTTSIIVTNKDEKNTEIGTGYDYNPTVTSQENLTDMVSDISNINNISFTCKTETNEELPGTVELGHEYTIRPEFQFYAPLELDPGSVIVYRDTLSDWNKDIESLRLSAGTIIEVKATVKNSLPMDLEFFVEPLQITKNGSLQVMSNDMMTTKVWTGDDMTQNKTAAGTIESPSTTTLNVILQQKDGEALAVLDGMMLGIKGVTPNNGKSHFVKETNSLKLENISILLKGKIVTGGDD